MDTRPTTRVWRALLFAGVAVVVFVASLALTSRITYRGWSLLAYLTDHLVEPGGPYQSLRRFREAEEIAETVDAVDVVVFGSSHAYRGFDPRIFSEAQLRLVNLGSTNQTPLNSRYLVERYVPKLRPKLVLFEVYYATLAGDGFEAGRDLVINTPWTWEMQRMAFATRHLGAIQLTMAKGLGLTADESDAVQRDIDGERYVPGGYCEAGGPRRSLVPREPFSVEVLPRQLDYLVDATAIAREHGAKVVWVTHPFPRDHREALLNYDEVHADIDQTAEEAKVPYWNFDGALELDPLAHFADFHHLDAEGVRIFDEAVIVELRNHGYVE